MSMFQFCAKLRAEILEIVTGVENSGGSLFWDNTTTNYETKRKLLVLYDKYLWEAKEFGLYVVTRHYTCPNSKHSGEPVSNAYGLPITYIDDNYVWKGGQIYQGERRCVCPCSPKNRQSEHLVTDDIIYDKTADQELCKNLEGVLDDVVLAINCAGDKKPRSAIRENLLRAVLRLNDQLLPEPMDIYIEKQL